MGFLACLVASPSRSELPLPTPCVGPFDPGPSSGSLPLHIYRAGEPVPINHPGVGGETSQVFKQEVMTGKEAGLPGFVHLSLVDFGDGGKADGRTALRFPEHMHGAGFHEVFLVLSGRGAMELDGVPTGTLTPGDAVHLPPGVVHSGQALLSDDGAHFRMAYFAIMNNKAV